MPETETTNISTSGDVVAGKVSISDFLWADRFFWIAVFLCLSLQAYPGTRWLLWPLKQFGVYVHELFHGLSSYVFGGSFVSMTMFPDGGGFATTTYYSSVGIAFVSAGGLLGPAILGGIILFFSRRFRLSNYLLKGLAVLFVLSAMLWASDWYTAGLGLGIAVVLGAVSFFPYKGIVRVFTQYLGVQLCLENLLDFDYMFTESFQRDGVEIMSDTAGIAAALGGSYFMWACIIAFLTLVIVVFSVIKSRPMIHE